MVLVLSVLVLLVFVLLVFCLVGLTSQNIYGKTVAHLARHHKNEWTLINAKSRAVQEGSDGLVRLQKAVGIIRDGVVMPLADELNNWAGADEVERSSLPTGNSMLPTQSDDHMRVALFGVTQRISKKRGRPPGLKNQSSRRRADCANKSCTRWYDCKGRFRKLKCEFGTGIKAGYYKPREMQRRRTAFDSMLASDPTLSQADAALAVCRI